MLGKLPWSTPLLPPWEPPVSLPLEKLADVTAREFVVGAAAAAVAAALVAAAAVGSLVNHGSWC